MDPAASLEQLAPLRLPAPVGWWPPAPGWWLLLLLLLAGLTALILWLVKRHLKNGYRRRGVQQLEQLQATGNANVAAVNRLLKAVAIHAYPARDAAALHGDHWLAFLQSTDPKLDDSALAPLSVIYQRPLDPAPPPLIVAARHWLRHHRRPHD